MMCHPNFLGDEDERLFAMQVEAYGEALSKIVTAARERYLDAEKVLRLSTTMGVLVRGLDLIDHRTVQDMHDLIAAWFRFKRRAERMFPATGDSRSEWLWFAEGEARELCDSADFVTGVLDACVYANTECGYAGEKRATKVQRSRYSEMIHYALPRPQRPDDHSEA